MIYLNFLHAPSGGGLQNSVSFLQTLFGSASDLEDYFCFVFEGSALHEFCINNKIKHQPIKNTLISKLIFEFSAFRIFSEGDIVFSIFGPPFFFTQGKTINIGGMAISNVFYPDIDFWGYLPFQSRLLKKIKDRYRVYRYKQLDYWIFETELLRNKAINQFNFPNDRTAVVKMAPSVLVSKSRIQKELRYPVDNNKIKILLLCGAHPNKRHHLLPALAKSLSVLDVRNIQFVFTSSSNDYLQLVESQMQERNVTDYFLNVGPVRPDQVATLIDCVDYVMNISVLESFSNNFVEAWLMQKPLLTVAEEWAISAAENAALYLRITDDKIDVQSFLDAIEANPDAVISEGRKQLLNYPNAEEKNQMYLKEISNAVTLGSLAVKLRRGISL